MTRRACPSSKSNTVVREIVLQLGLQESIRFGQKNENISKSVSSIHSGPIYSHRLGQDLYRNAFVVSFLFPGAELHRWKGFSHDPENRDFHEISTFLES